MPHLTKATLEGFAGAKGSYALGPLTAFISADNAVGKSTTLHTILIGLTGKVDGRRPTKDSLPYQELADKDGRWLVSLADSDGVDTTRQWTGSQHRIRISDSTLPDLNDAHEAAVAARYANIEILDVAALIAMKPEALYRYVMGLCASAGSLTRASIAEALTTTHPSIAELLPDLLSVDEGTDDQDALGYIEELQARLDAAMTQKRNDVKRINAVIREPEKPWPPGATLAELLAEQGEIEKEIAPLRDEVGRLKGKITEAKEAEQGNEANEKKRTEVLGKVGKVEKEISRLDAEIEKTVRLVAGSKVNPELRQIAERKVKELDDAWQLCDNDLTAKRETLIAAEKEAKALKSGTCPTCGKACKQVFDKKQGAVKRAQKALDKSQADRDQVAGELNEHQRLLDRAKEGDEHLKEQGRLEKEGLAQETALDALYDQLRTIDVELAAYAPEKIEADREVLAIAENTIADLNIRNTPLQSKIDKINAAVDYNAELNERKSSSLWALFTVRHREELIKAVQVTVLDLHKRIVSDSIAPLAERVNTLMEGRVGTFIARFRPVFRLGFDRPEWQHFTPLHKLCAGEMGIFTLALVATLHDLHDDEAALKLAMLDNFEALSDEHQEIFIETAKGMIDYGLLDQVIFAGLIGMIDDEGITVHMFEKQNREVEIEKLRQ